LAQAASRRIELLDEDFPEAEPGPEKLLIRKEQEQSFMKALDQLSLPHRAVLLLHFIEEFPLEEIARITETQLGTVKSRLHYARRALRKLLEENET
jgi:RNA polymerase sigma-70 factor (ECF subfamily)